MGPPPASPEQKPRLRAGAAAARGFRPPRGCACCSNTRARYIRAPHKRDPLGRNPLASMSVATMAFFASAGHFFWYAGAGIDEATDIQVAKDAAVRGSGASRPWMACARLLAPWTAQSGDAHDPRTAAAPPEANGFRRFSSWADLASSDWAKNQEKSPTVAGWGFNWWRWAESNRRPKALHLRYYMLSSPLGLVPWQHGVRSAPWDQPVLG